MQLGIYNEDADRCCVMEEQEIENGALARAQHDGNHAQPNHQYGEAEGDHLVHEVIATLLHAPCLVERDLERQEDTGARNQDHDEREDLDTVAR